MINLPPKPPKRSTCNGCGLCCRMERCGFAVDIIGAGPGPCPALEYDGGRAWCGLLRDPLKWVPAELTKLLPDQSIPAVIGQCQITIAYGLAIGAGCDSEDI